MQNTHREQPFRPYPHQTPTLTIEHIVEMFLSWHYLSKVSLLSTPVMTSTKMTEVQRK